MQTVINELLAKHELRTLIFALGKSARVFFEKELPKCQDIQISVKSIVNSRKNIKILFLDKLQYFFIYLAHLSIKRFKPLEFDRFVVYGLDEMLGCDSAEMKLLPSQVTLSNQIFSMAFEIINSHNTEILFLSVRTENEDLKRIESYWRNII